MPTDHRAVLAAIRRFDQLIAYLRDEMGWPIAQDSFDDVDDLFFDFTPEELGIDAKNAAKIQEIRRLRPLSTHQPWGIFFVKFEPKRLPVVALRRILSQVALKKRASANSDEQAAWSADDLLFVSNYGEGGNRQITFAHFAQCEAKKDLPTLKVLGWDNLDTPLHLDHVAELLTERLSWPDDEEDKVGWGRQWRSAFTLVHREVITTSKELSIGLAGLARSIRECINAVLAIEIEDGPVSKLMAAFRATLVHDLDEDGFADMYAQTIAYGLLSARVANPSDGTADDVVSAMPVTSPFLKELMETFLDVGGRKGGANEGGRLDFDELGVGDVVELLDAANMEAVIRDFGDKNPQEDPVIHFYELFLKEYDAKKRMQRGVFYTPRPVVSFIVRSVDELLRSEFGLEDGLADTTTWGEMADRAHDLEIPEGATPDQAFVQILDPATGTGTFLVEVIGHIRKTITEKWQAEGRSTKKIEQLWNSYVPKHLLPRLYGYELMMAPYAIAHMKIGLKLYETGYRFESDERARVYLTNALEPSDDRYRTSMIPALAHEAEAVNEIKRNRRFTVVIGNPPYSNYGQQNKNTWIMSLLEDYKRDLNEKKLNLDDDYIKFIRLGHHIIDQCPLGLLGVITNHTYLDGITHRRLRECLTVSFGTIHILDIHGSIKKAEKAPDGSKDENVFDIQQGVAIGAFVRSNNQHGILHSDLWGTRTHKSQWLTANSVTTCPAGIITVDPDRFYFAPYTSESDSEYSAFVRITDIFHETATGFETARDHFAIAFTEDAIRKRISDLLGSLPDHEIREKWKLDDKRDWTLAESRARLRRMGNPYEDIRNCCYRPFDVRFTHYNTATVTWPRKKALGSITRANPALVASRMIKGEDPHHFFIVSHPTEKIFISAKTSNNAFLFPMYRQAEEASLFAGPGEDIPLIPNIRDNFAATVSSQSEYEAHEHLSRLFSYIYAVFHSREYRIRYAEFFKRDFPKVPIPVSGDLFDDLVDLGKEVISMHLMEAPALQEYVTTLVGSGDYQVEKVSHSNETVWLDKAKTRGFQGVPEEVWNFHIGGYRPCDKWLKYRQTKGGKNPRPGCVLTDEDINHYQRIVVSLSETIRIMAEIDEVIEAHGGWPGAFQTGEVQAAESRPSHSRAAETTADYLPKRSKKQRKR